MIVTQENLKEAIDMMRKDCDKVYANPIGVPGNPYVFFVHQSYINQAKKEGIIDDEGLTKDKGHRFIATTKLGQTK